MKFSPMEKYERSVVHDVAEVAGLPAFSFGDDAEGQRHVVIWHKECAPTEPELETLRRGKDWDEKEWIREKEEKEWRDKLEEEQERQRKKNQQKFVPNKGDYKEKYQHLIGKLC